MMAGSPLSEEVAVLAVVDALPHPAALLGPDGVPVFINAAERAFLGIPDDDETDPGAASLTFIHPDDHHLFTRMIDTLVQQRAGSTTVEMRVRRHDGVFRWQICSAASLGVSSVRSWLVTLTDIEDLRQQQADLTTARTQADESLALLDTLQSRAPIGFALVDRDFTFHRINDFLADIDGVPAEEHLGRQVREVVPELWEQLEPVYRRALSGEAVHDVEIVGETKARPGERRVWVASYYPVRSQDDQPVAGIGVVARDVTDERRMAAQLTQAQKMQAVGQLAGGVAHDFNNVLATITLSADVLRSRIDDPDQRAGLDRILAATRSATELTRKLLYFARRQPTRPAGVDVAEVVHRVLDMVSGSLGSTIEVDVDVAGCPPVLVDPTHFEQVLLNLVINARDAMPGGGRLSVSAVLAPAGVRLDGTVVPEASVALVVADTGLGMSQEVRDRALEPFFTTKSAGSGTGLGLSTVHGIVDGAGGRISIYSEPGLGTSVQVELPVADLPANVTGEPEVTPPRGRGERVLVVEDQGDLRRTIVTILQAGGYDVTSAADGADALDALTAADGIDLVLSDVVMPGLTGPELSEAVMAAYPGTPVVLMSGYVGGVLASHGVLSEALVLTKPFTSDTLLATVATALRRSVSERG
jgi:PAS domain S-box-containing protein